MHQAPAPPDGCTLADRLSVHVDGLGIDAPATVIWNPSKHNLTRQSVRLHSLGVIAAVSSRPGLSGCSISPRWNLVGRSEEQERTSGFDLSGRHPDPAWVVAHGRRVPHPVAQIGPHGEQQRHRQARAPPGTSPAPHPYRDPPSTGHSPRGRHRRRRPVAVHHFDDCFHR